MSLLIGLRVLAVASVVIGATTTPGNAWALGDIGVGVTTWLNIIAITIVQIPAHKALWDYQRQKKAGLDPVFEPEKLRIKNADFWRSGRWRNASRRSVRPATATAKKQLTVSLTPNNRFLCTDR